MMTRQRAARNLLLFLFILAVSIIAAVTNGGCSTAGGTGGGIAGYTGEATIGTKPGETTGDVYVRVVVRDSTGAELVVYYPMHLFKSSAVPVTGP